MGASEPSPGFLHTDISQESKYTACLSTVNIPSEKNLSLLLCLDRIYWDFKLTMLKVFTSDFKQ